jgi:hypothetical protein
LLNPRDRTAANTPWEVVLISWPAQQIETQVDHASYHPTSKVDFDDSGWQSARGQ